jgi:hypothetical protein
VMRPMPAETSMSNIHDEFLKSIRVLLVAV